MKYTKILALFIVCSIIFVSGCGKKKDVQNVIVPTNGVVLDSQKVGDYEFSPLSITFDKGISKLITYIKNVSTESKEIKIIEFILYNEKDVVITTLYSYIGKTFVYNEKNIVELSSTIEFLDVKKIEYIVK